MKEVTGSSNISHVGYKPDKNIIGTLHVRFKNGAEWTYSGVTPRQHEEFMKAESMGSWLRHNIVTRRIAHPGKQIKAASK